MSINNVNNGGAKPSLENQRLSQQQQALNTNAQKADTQSKSGVTARQDSVSLTSSAQQLSQVQKKSSEAPVNQEKVERLKKAIANGEYKINPDSMAQKMATLEAEIFGSKA